MMVGNVCGVGESGGQRVADDISAALLMLISSNASVSFLRLDSLIQLCIELVMHCAGRYREGCCCCIHASPRTSTSTTNNQVRCYPNISELNERAQYRQRGKTCWGRCTLAAFQDCIITSSGVAISTVIQSECT
jgi:hypothetical protein